VLMKINTNSTLVENNTQQILMYARARVSVSTGFSTCCLYLVSQCSRSCTVVRQDDIILMISIGRVQQLLLFWYLALFLVYM
jgi:hypothetical protein